LEFAQTEFKLITHFFPRTPPLPPPLRPVIAQWRGKIRAGRAECPADTRDFR